ncbi:RNA-guided endonuclease InsQ/TnpB family protein [Actinomadura bangladeshensis]|uniref:Transposase n=1 Tax=Actinomadura bangladeshensis TaxID=453573 RepID=A0A4R4NVN0_9ACTN|nr:RNA-guided endonuclease TnpB family protein [Actinomadura bangladeshensis]TDC13838.1 transposase [Actinomadura bangladeshensis]
MARQVKRAFRCRFYPTDEQAAELSRTFGCARLAYNRALEARTRAWYGEQRRVSYVETSAMLTAWKKTPDLAFLVSGPLDIVWSGHLPEGAEPSTVTVSRDAAGRWFVSLLCDDTITRLNPADRAVGIDAGVTSLVTLSTGEKVTNPRHERRDRERLARAQRDLSRKAKGSKNREKARVRVARIHARIADRRRDLLHQLTTRLVHENQVVVIEDLHVAGMVRNHRLARAISDAAWRDLRTMLEYKADWYGRELVVIDRWFPSSKLCGDCGTVAGSMPLNVRQWECGCGAVHDRDINAAKNVLAAGLAVSACGADVRPKRREPGGQSATKQETRPARVGVPRH